MDVTVVVGTYGGPEWHLLAQERALPSAAAQGCQAIHSHGENLMDARNQGLAKVTTEWVIFLDADDELGDGYVTEMLAATGDIRAPRVSYVTRGNPESPRFPRTGGRRHQCTGACLESANWIVIGAMARTSLVRQAGGFGPEPIYEDYALWLRMWRAGATVTAVPGAVYRAHVSAGPGRNTVMPASQRREVHQMILAQPATAVPLVTATTDEPLPSRRLRIAYIGNFSVDYSTETHVAHTLEQLGHTVYRLQENGHKPAGLTRALNALDLDLFLFTRTWGQTVRMTHLNRLRARSIPTVSYHLDLYLGLQRDGGIDTDPFWRTDWVFTPDGDPACQTEFERRGINHRWLLPGVVADECYLADVPLTRDITFVGSRQYHTEWPYRTQLLDWLARTYGDRFEHHGPEGLGLARGDDLNRLYASTRIVIGDSLVQGFTHEAYASDRRYETPGRGGFMLQPWIDGFDDGFVDGVNAAFYRFGDFDSLAAKIRHYLANDAEREQIRRAGHDHVKAHHTYTHRLTSMLDILRTEGAIP